MLSGLGVLHKLGTLDLDGNPSSISNCSRLTVLELGRNPLVNPQLVPSWVASLVNLTRLDLSGMNLVGEITSVLGQISKLDYLILQDNQFSERIPQYLGNCTNLTHIFLIQIYSLERCLKKSGLYRTC